jgi:hypothetical protein
MLSTIGALFSKNWRATDVGSVRLRQTERLSQALAGAEYNEPPAIVTGGFL